MAVPPGSPTFDVTEEVFADYVVLHMPNRLGERATTDAPPPGDEPDPVASAERLLADLSGEFVVWADEEAKRLDRARRALAESRSADALQDVYQAAHDLRGQASTLGFPIAGVIAEGICVLIERFDGHAPPQTLIDRHVEAIRAVVREGVRDDAHPVGRALARRLAELRNAVSPGRDG